MLPIPFQRLLSAHQERQLVAWAPLVDRSDLSQEIGAATLRLFKYQLLAEAV